MRIKKSIFNNIDSLAVFVITAIISVICFALNGIYPGSEKIIFVFDMGSQYVSFYSYLNYIGEGFNNLMHQSFSAFGGGFFGTWAYYLSSPLSWLILLFDKQNVPDAVYFITILKLCLSGVSFSIFIKKGHLKCTKSSVVILSSVSYALMSYNIVYSISLMWLDGVIMLPLIILGADYILEGKKRNLFVVSLFFSLIFSYYITYMIILFLIIYFFWYAFSESFVISKICQKAYMFFLSGIQVLIFSAWFWIPVLFDLKKGKLNEGAVDSAFIIRNPISVLKQFLPLSYDGFSPNNLPFLYCGISVSAFFVIYFFIKKISVRKKIVTLVVFLFFIVSFCFSGIDVIWHGFRIPNMYPARYSFVVSFFAILLFSESSIYLYDRFELASKKAIMVLLSIFLLLDVGFNSMYLVSSVDVDELIGPYIYRNTFNTYYLQTESVKDHLIDGEVFADYNFTSDDGYLYGMKYLDCFSSSYNAGVSDFLHDLGLASMNHYISSEGLTPLSASFLGVNNIMIRFSQIANNGSSANMISEYYDETYSVDSVRLYTSPKPVTGGYFLPDSSTCSDIFGWNVFENNNMFSSDISGVENIFVPCDCICSSEGLSEEGYYINDITVYPESGSHLLFYVSAQNYCENSRHENHDELYLGDSRIAFFENNGLTRIVDLGISNGEPIQFTYVSDSEFNSVYFYSFNEVNYRTALDTVYNNQISSFSYSADGMSFDIFNETSGKVLLLLPYEDGYFFKLDGRDIDYQAYRDALILLDVPEGSHHIKVSYFTPGLKIGICISSAGILFTLSYYVVVSFSSRRKREDEKS